MFNKLHFSVPLVLRKQNMVQQHINMIVSLLNTAWLQKTHSPVYHGSASEPTGPALTCAWWLDISWHIQNDFFCGGV